MQHKAFAVPLPTASICKVQYQMSTGKVMTHTMVLILLTIKIKT